MKAPRTLPPTSCTEAAAATAGAESKTNHETTKYESPKRTREPFSGFRISWFRDSDFLTEHARGGTRIRSVGQQPFALHHHAVRQHVGVLANVGAVEQHRRGSHARMSADLDAIDLEDAI